MPRTLADHSKEIIRLLKLKGIAHTPRNIERGIFKIGDYTCRAGSPFGQDKYKINIALGWFQDPQNQDKPDYPNIGYSIDCYLFAQDDALLALGRANLQKFAVQLEHDRDRWIGDPNWGMVLVSEASGTFFNWLGDQQRFRLREINDISELLLECGCDDRRSQADNIR